ncbi:GTP-binding protein LepA [Kribbella sp. CA-294648]|uniref:GTP-binding protein LepA n=1 Tax=Kribbella sp. CA-294648 TaxID=3239948 RepID=UPI003D9185DA
MTTAGTPPWRRLKRGIRRPFSVERRLVEHVDRLAEEHPPIPLGSADYSMARPQVLAKQLGPVVTYMSRVELEVERNVLELNMLLPDPPPIDRHFYADVWLPQETHHGLLLDRLQSLAGLPPATPDLTHVSFSFRVLGALGRLNAVQDVSRMMYYLTGVATEQSAILAYNRLHQGLLDLGERAIASSIIAPIRRQEPGHFAYYKIAAQGLWTELAQWQKWLVRTLRRHTFEPVGAYTKKQWAEFGDVMHHLGITTNGEAGITRYAQQIGRVELELLYAQRQGLRVPTYVLDSLRSAARLAAADRRP